MNIPSFAKKIFQRFAFFRHIRFTHITILIYGTIALAVLVISALGWDTYLFIQSISPLEAVEIKEPKKISLASKDIDEAIRIINQRQEKFTTLLKATNASSTISF